MRQQREPKVHGPTPGSSAVPDPALAARAERLAPWAAIGAVAIGVTVLIGWVANIPPLKMILPMFVSMKLNTALCLTLAGLAFLERTRGRRRPLLGALGLAAACAVAVIAVMTLVEYATGTNLGIDELFMKDDPKIVFPAPPGRMAPNTAAALLLIAGAVLTHRRRGAVLTVPLATGVVLLAGVGFIGYLYGVRSLYAAGKATAMAVHTTTALMLLGAAVLLANRGRGYMATLLSAGQGGRMARRLIPAALATSIILGWLRLMGQHLGLYGTVFGVAILIISHSIIITALILMAARSSDRSAAGIAAAEGRLAHREEEYRRLFEDASDSIVVFDGKLICLEMNAAAERLLGHSRTELVGKDLSAFVDPAELAARPALTPSELVPGEPVVRQRRFRQGDGTMVDIESSIKMMPDGRIMSIARDVSALRALEAQLLQTQKLDALGKLAGGIAHDFNNMLMVILNRAELIKRKLGTDEPRYRWADDIIKAGRQSGNLIQQLLAAARKQVLQPKVVDPSEVVQEMLGLLSQSLPENIHIHTSIQPGLWRVLADPAKLSQVLLNLAVNARDAMPDGGSLIFEARNFLADAGYARRHLDVPHGELVLLVVSDTGSGIPEAVRDRIFDPFFTTKEVGRGTGLGLSVVHGIVEQMGGRINVYSEVGQGTTFKIYFPRFEGDVEHLEPEVVSHRGGRETILVVEDSELVRKVLTETLREEGYSVLEAADPNQALRLSEMHAGPIDLLLSDVMLPVMNGSKLAERISADRPEVKVILMSGYTDDAIARHGILEQGVRFLEKPVLAGVLLNNVRSVLDESQA